MQYTQQDRFHLTGLPTYISDRLKKTVDKWLKSCGPEWTVERLKSLKILYINRLGGLPDPDVWISLDSMRIPNCSGFRELFHFHKKSKKVWYALFSYTGITVPSMTVKQWVKFHDSVVAKPAEDHSLPWLSRAIEEIKNYVPSRVPLTVVVYPWSETKRAPNIDCKKTDIEGPSSVSNDIRSGILESLGYHCCDEYIYNTVTRWFCGSAHEGRMPLEHQAARIIADGYKDAGPLFRMMASDCEILYDRIDTKPYVGRIGCIQEPGCKARVIANPRRIFQVLLYPFGKQLFEITKRLPWDCYDNQQLGIKWVREKLRTGHVVGSVDLADASNHLPLELQIDIFQRLGLDDFDIKLFEKVCRGSWYVPDSISSSIMRDYKRRKVYNPVLTVNDRIDAIAWTKGQPLGLFPSFPACFLAHGIMLRCIEIELNKVDSFRIIGDDVVISDTSVLDSYRRLLQRFLMPVSEGKCITSAYVAEFGGHVVTQDRIYSPIKWRKVDAVNNPNVIQSIVTSPLSADTLLHSSKLDHYLAGVMKIAMRPIGKGEHGSLSLRERARIIMPLWITRDTTPLEEISLGCETHDVSFRSSDEYRLIFDKELTSRNSLPSSLGRFDKPETLPGHIKVHGLAIFFAIASKFKFNEMKVPKNFLNVSRELRSWRSLAKPIQGWLKPTLGDRLLKRRFIKGQLALMRLSETTLKEQLEECIEFLRDTDIFVERELPPWMLTVTRGGMLAFHHYAHGDVYFKGCFSLDSVNTVREVNSLIEINKDPDFGILDVPRYPVSPKGVLKGSMFDLEDSHMTTQKIGPKVRY